MYINIFLDFERSDQQRKSWIFKYVLFLCTKIYNIKVISVYNIYTLFWVTETE